MRFPLVVGLWGLAASVLGGTVTGKVGVLDRGNRSAKDLTEAVVYIDGFKVPTKPAKTTVVMKGKSFSPHLVVVDVGGTVEFPNEDPIFHNVFSVSADNRFDLDLYKRPKSGSWTFEHPGVARVYCNIHPQMSAVVVVRDNPFHVRPQADGSFTIEGVPAGKYTLTAWHERGGEASTQIVVPADGSVSAQLLLDASKFKEKPHKNKFGKDYETDSPTY